MLIKASDCCQSLPPLCVPPPSTSSFFLLKAMLLTTTLEHLPPPQSACLHSQAPTRNLGMKHPPAGASAGL